MKTLDFWGNRNYSDMLKNSHMDVVFGMIKKSHQQEKDYMKQKILERQNSNGFGTQRTFNGVKLRYKNLIFIFFSCVSPEDLSMVLSARDRSLSSGLMK